MVNGKVELWSISQHDSCVENDKKRLLIPERFAKEQGVLARAASFSLHDARASSEAPALQEKCHFSPLSESGSGPLNLALLFCVSGERMCVFPFLAR
jgi:hypothetical protein